MALTLFCDYTFKFVARKFVVVKGSYEKVEESESGTMTSRRDEDLDYGLTEGHYIGLITSTIIESEYDSLLKRDYTDISEITVTVTNFQIIP